MQKIFPKVINHQHVIVKGAAIHALSYLSEFLQPDILMYHQVIMPALINHCQNIEAIPGQTQKQHDDNLRIVSKAASSLEVFISSLEEDQIEPYLPQLIPTFGKIINSQCPQLLKVFAMCCVGTCLDVAKHAYLPYFNDTVAMLDHIINLKSGPEVQELQCEAIINLGKVSSTFCRDDMDKFKQYILPYMEPLYSLLVNNQDYKIREATLTFFYHVADTIKAEFGGFIDRLMVFLFAVIGSEAKLTEDPKQKKAGDFSLDSDSEADDFDPEGKQTRGQGSGVRQDFLDEKAAAVKALGCFAVACPMQFAPYFEKAFVALDGCYNYFYENIRIQAISAYKDLCSGLVMASNGGVLPPVQKGVPSALNEQVKAYIQIETVTKYLFYMDQDESQEVVQATIECFDQMIKDLGLVVVEKCYDDLTKSIDKLLRGEGNCQIPMDEEEDEEDEETNIYVFEALTDLIPTLAKVLKSGFVLIFKQLYEAMFLYTSKNKDINDNIQIIGTFAQCFKYCPELIDGLSPQFLQWLVKSVGQDDQLDRNLCYCFGLLCEKRPLVCLFNNHT